jgi:putative membrane protein
MDTEAGGQLTPGGTPDQTSFELSARRTGLSFQRTRLSADRTLMAVIRTSLSLIGFGFTIFQVFQKLYEADVLKRAQAPRHFGRALVLLGVAALALGIVYHVRFMLELRRRRSQLRAQGLIHAETGFPASQTLIIALLLLAIGVFATVSMLFDVGPFE